MLLHEELVVRYPCMRLNHVLQTSPCIGCEECMLQACCSQLHMLQISVDSLLLKDYGEKHLP